MAFFKLYHRIPLVGFILGAACIGLFVSSGGCARQRSTAPAVILAATEPPEWASLRATRWSFCQTDGLDLRALQINALPIDWIGRQTLLAPHVGVDTACLGIDGSASSVCVYPISTDQTAYGDATRYGSWCAINAHYASSISDLMNFGLTVDQMLDIANPPQTVNAFLNCKSNFTPSSTFFNSGTPFIASTYSGVALYSELEFSANGSVAKIQYYARPNGCDDKTNEEILGSYQWSTSFYGTLDNDPSFYRVKESLLDEAGVNVSSYRIYKVEADEKRLYISSQFYTVAPSNWPTEFNTFLANPRTNALKWFKEMK